MSITSMGIGSGLDIKSLVQQLVAAEGQATSTRLNRAESKFKGQLSALGSFKSALSSLQSALTGVKDLAQKFSATSADTSIFAATASSTALSGSYKIEVTQLAQAQADYVSGFADTTSNVAGTLTITGPTGTTYTYSDAASGGADKSLTQIRDAINGVSGLGVVASIVQKSTNDYALVLTAADTGSTNGFSLSAATGKFADGVNWNNGTNIATHSQSALDATMKVNGVQVTRSSNTVSDVITGVTLTLKAKSTAGQTTNLTVANDESAITTAIEGFVKAYNSLATNVKSNSGYNAETKQAGPLLGDATVRTVMSQIRGVVSDRGKDLTVGGTPYLSGTVQSLMDIGISSQSDGTLAFDKTKLSSALSSNATDIEKLFNYLETELNGNLLTPVLQSGGYLSERIDGLNSNLKDISKQRSALELRLDAAEKRYMAQFTAMDSLVAKFNSTGSYLSQHLSSLY